jgi:hypothetical protein
MGRGILFGGLGLIVVTLLVKNPAQLPDVKFELESPEIVKGRFLETFRRTEVDPFWYGVQTEINEENQKASWAYGLFTDSSPNGPYLGSLIRSLKPESYPVGEGFFIETKTADEQKAGEALSYFGISQLLNLEDEQKKSVGSLEKGEETQFFNLEKASESGLFEVAQLPLRPVKGNWNKEVEKWWLQEGKLTDIPYLVAGKGIDDASQKDLQKASVQIADTNERQTEYKLRINSETPAPVLAKISYFPYWKAVDDEGKEIPIYRAAPNLMLLEGKGNVILEYEEPLINRLVLVVSLLGWVVVVGLLIRNLVKQVT